MNNNNAGEHFAIAALFGYVITLISKNVALLQGLASMATIVAAGVSILYALRRGKQDDAKAKREAAKDEAAGGNG